MGKTGKTSKVALETAKQSDDPEQDDRAAWLTAAAVRHVLPGTERTLLREWACAVRVVDDEDLRLHYDGGDAAPRTRHDTRLLAVICPSPSLSSGDGEETPAATLRVSRSVLARLTREEPTTADVLTADDLAIGMLSLAAHYQAMRSTGQLSGPRLALAVRSRDHRATVLRCPDATQVCPICRDGGESLAGYLARRERQAARLSA